MKPQRDEAKIEELYSYLDALRKDFHHSFTRSVIADWLDVNLEVTETRRRPIVPNWFRLLWMRRARRARAFSNTWDTNGFQIQREMSECVHSQRNYYGRWYKDELDSDPCNLDHFGTADILGIPCFVSEPYADDARANIALRFVAELSGTFDIFTRSTWHGKKTGSDSGLRRVILFPGDLKMVDECVRKPRARRSRWDRLGFDSSSLIEAEMSIQSEYA